MSLTAEPIPLLAAARLGEGALWDDRHNLLLWIDIHGQTFHRYTPATGQQATTYFDEEIGTVAPRALGGWVVALRSRLQAVTPDGTPGEVLALHPMPGLRFNDGKCDPAGRLWVGTFADAWIANSALYRIDPPCSFSQMLDGVICSNGLVWSQNQRTMYYIDSGTQRVDAFDYNRAAGTIKNRRPVVDFAGQPGVPDGMAIDAEGMLWIAIYSEVGDAGHVLRCNPHNGEIIDDVTIPGVTEVTSCAFSGEDLRTLYITTAACLDVETLARQPHAGRLFQVAAPVAGMPAFRFAG